MRIVVSEFISLDGVVQAPGGHEEDTDGGFRHGGWSMPFFDPEVMGSFVSEGAQRTDALLYGRRLPSVASKTTGHHRTHPSRARPHGATPLGRGRHRSRPLYSQRLFPCGLPNDHPRLMAPPAPPAPEPPDRGWFDRSCGSGPGGADVGVLCLPLRAWSWLGLRRGAAGAVALPARWCLATRHNDRLELVPGRRAGWPSVGLVAIGPGQGD
jgi:hypothetical protein